MRGMKFSRNPGCDSCDLSAGCRSICVPCRPHRGEFPPRNPKSRAVLIVGEAPGYQEDQEGRAFVGPSGETLRRLYIEDLFGIHKKADVYVTNAVRCRPPENNTPTAKQLKACRPYLESDLHVLSKIYDDVWVLCVGATAAKAFGYKSLRDALTRQGVEVEGARVFSTYHPAYLLRNPSALPATEEHLRLLNDELEGKRSFSVKGSRIQEAPEPPDYRIPMLSLDIETYGVVSNLPAQTQFHPRKSQVYDRVPVPWMIQTVGLSWEGPDGEIQNAIFTQDKIKKLWPWLQKVREEDGVLLGQNMQFDLMYLRYCYPASKVWLEYPMKLCDLSVTNYLHDPSRPERSLKALAPLLSVTSYDLDADNFQVFRDFRDPRLWEYNCQDTEATLLCQRKLEEMIRHDYPYETNKLSDTTRDWYTQVLWLTIWMAEAGVAMSSGGLEALYSRFDSRRRRLAAFAAARWEMPLSGEGSDKAKREAIQDALDYLGDDAPQDLELTAKRKAVSFCEQNRQKLLGCLPHSADVSQRLRAIKRHAETSKILDSYLFPLLNGRKVSKTRMDMSPRIIDGIVYPRWYPVPSQFDDGQAGGTQQARIVCKAPAIQTFPKTIKSCIECRYEGGELIWFDYSQIELRVAALLSGDEPMMQEYRGSPDLHGRTAQLIFGPDIVDHPQYKVKYRQAGKTLNFLMLFRGGAQTFQDTLMRDVGVDLELDKCREAVNSFWARHKTLKNWQDTLIATAIKTHFIELPLIGQSRWFPGGRSGVRRQIAEICNIPVQAGAANIMLSAQFELWWTFKQRGLRSIVPLNIYDAAAVEVRPGERSSVLAIMDQILPNPPYYQALCEQLGRSLPLEYEIE